MGRLLDVRCCARCAECGGVFSLDEWEDEDRACATCGDPVEDDPDGSPGVLVHARTLGDEAYDLDEDHPALDDTDYGI